MKKRKFIRKTFGVISFVLIIVVLALWLISPYKGYGAGKIRSSVDIELPCAYVYKYLGNSDHAADWSVYVAFIESLNVDEYPDGSIGSKRVCYTEEDKSGFKWEEEILENRKNQYRKLSCYNFQNLYLSSPDLVTEQIYEDTNNGCLLSFTLDFREKPSFLSLIKMKYASFTVARIFKRNLANILTEVVSKNRNRER